MWHGEMLVELLNKLLSKAQLLLISHIYSFYLLLKLQIKSRASPGSNAPERVSLSIL